MSRAGSFIKQPEGYKSFVPKNLPPDPPIEWDEELHEKLSKADRALGRFMHSLRLYTLFSMVTAELAGY